MRPRLLLFAAAVLGCGFAPAPFPRPAKKAPAVIDIKTFQGTWLIESRSRYQDDGQLVKTPPKTMKVRVEGERWSYVAVDAGGERVTVTYRLSVDTTKSPHWFECVNEKRPTAIMRGLFRMEGDTITFVYRFASSGKIERPVSMTAPEKQANVMIVRRLKS